MKEVGEVFFSVSRSTCFAALSMFVGMVVDEDDNSCRELEAAL